MIGVTNLVIYGFSGAGIPILLTLVVLTTLFLDFKAGLITISISLISMMIVGYLYTQNILSLSISLNKINTYSVSWITASAVLVLLGGLCVVSIAIVQRKMLQSVKYSNYQAVELNNLNVKLQADIKMREQADEALRNLKRELEIKVEVRTKELQAKVSELQHFHDVTIERELRMKEMQDEIKELKNKLKLTTEN